MADEAEKKPTTSAPPAARKSEAHSLSAAFEIKGDMSANINRAQMIDIDRPLSSAQDWLRATLDRMTADPDCPEEITQAARRLEIEMAEAFRRRQVNEAWAWGSIKNKLLTCNWWPRTRKRPDAS
jgi:hypothetical protein